MNAASSRRLLLLACFFFSLLPPALAQRPAGGGRAQGPRMERLENARIAYITDKISLTSEQAQRFWPVYNEFADKRRELRRQSRLGLRGQDLSAMSDKDIRAALEDQFKVRQGEINLEKDYIDKFQKVISLRQVAQLLQAERDFTKALIQRLDGQPGSPAAPGRAAQD